MNGIDWNLHNEYPILYPICSTLEIDKKEIDDITNWLWDDWKINLKYDKKQTQLVLKAIIFRLDRIGKSLNEISFYKNVSPDTMIEVFGVRQIEIAEALINKSCLSQLKEDHNNV